MDKIVFQVKQSVLHPVSNLLKDKGSLIAGASAILFISTFLSVLVSWSLTFHSLNESILYQQEVNIDRHRNVTEALASAIKTIQEKQLQMLTKLQVVERSAENFVSKTYVDIRFNDAKELSTRINNTVLETKRISETLQETVKVSIKKQNETNTDILDTINEMKGHDETHTADLKSLIASFDDEMKEQSLETAKIQEKLSTSLTSLESELSNTKGAVDKLSTSVENNKNDMKEIKENLKVKLDESETLKNISDNLAIAATIISNTTESSIPQETVSAIQDGLVLQVTAQLKKEIDDLETGLDAEVNKITEAAVEELAFLKEDLKMFKLKYQNDRFKTLGYIEIGDNGKYLVSSNSKNWAAAQRDCSNKMGYLVEFGSQAEQDQVVNYLQTNGHDLDVFWLGGRDLENEGEYTWQHSHKKLSETFNSWHEGEPNDYGHGEDCVEFTDGKWNDVSCDEDRHYICKFDTKNLTI